MTAVVCAKCNSVIAEDGRCWWCDRQAYLAERPWQDVVREVIDILSATRHTFRSKQVERARRLLMGLIE